jgi:CIC family chloride channel protein
MRILSSYHILINWLHAKLNSRQFLMVSSVLVGLTAGLAAVLLKTLVHYIHLGIVHDYHIRFQYYLYLIFPLIGILFTVYIVKRFLRGKLGKGTANILHSIVRKSAFLPKDQVYSHIITSAVTVGFGGSAGLESPIVTTGSAIGSNYCRTYHLPYKDRVLLLACGAAAGIAAAFNSPIAGVLFALEVLLVDVTISAFLPLIIAAAVGTLCSKIILREGFLLSFSLQEPFDFHNVPFYMILGVLAGMVSVYYTRTFVRIGKFFGTNKQKVYQKAIVGGLILAVLIFLFPPLFGEGYESIKVLSQTDAHELLNKSILSKLGDNDWFLLFFIGAVMFIKVIAASITINSGGNGGNFAPSLFVGAYLGYFFSRFINLSGISTLPISNFTIVAMAGILTGVFHAPLTGIFLIAEITGGYELMVPLMIVSAISYLVVKYFEPLSMDEKALLKKGHIITQNKDKTILSSLKMDKMIETDFQKVQPEATLRELTEIVAHSTRNIFPVVNAENNLVGIIYLDTIREIMFKSDLYDTVLVEQLMRNPPVLVSPNEHMHSVMKKFDSTSSWNLPVVEDGQYVGFVSKSSLLTKYRLRLIKTSAD